MAHIGNQAVAIGARMDGLSAASFEIARRHFR
jgi:hypothetical protein